ncbi:hypothetical protein CI109_102863 [Kwoniella shandongensis]|uniref:Ribosomal RNA-processing protein 8 n=1 Tax=Kwoniella shandongensis TaxID=1734106 RepID=A0A5M6CCQ2_9TREE|nr:uncharacterized protein CI109_000053 [Kwoniella shandongensis]KAA5531215.1 hypothetical protein CI109_000053 [Kwoniella shandongensis]
MSLFPSAFDSSLPGPSKALSTTPLPGSKSHKRKRPSASHDGKGKDEQLLRSTQANLEKLMSKIEKGNLKEKEEGREGMGAGISKNAKKKARQSLGGESEGEGSTPSKGKYGQDGSKKQKSTQTSASNTPKSKEQKLQKKDGKSTPVKQSGSKQKAQPVELEIPMFSSSSEKAAMKVGGEGKLTEMQAKMQAKLEGARFRWINEQLYSTPSTEAVAMMKKDPKIFADYHETHRFLTAGWPSPPLPLIIKLLAPLPAGSVVVDLGCGDAGLARALVPQGKIVLSYDLVGDSGVPGSEQEAKTAGGWVVEADFLEKVPLPGRPGGLEHTKSEEKGKKKGRGGKDAAASEVVDAVVCCLSLMGMNWVGGIFEACRVLKQGGSLHIAEVTSRFISTEDFVKMVESFGFELEEQDSPSSHFTLFRFTKSADVPQGPARGQKGWTERVQGGEEILRACVYKKR